MFCGRIFVRYGTQYVHIFHYEFITFDKILLVNSLKCRFGVKII